MLLVQVREIPASDPGPEAPHMSQDSPLSLGSPSGGSEGTCLLNLRRPRDALLLPADPGYPGASTAESQKEVFLNFLLGD